MVNSPGFKETDWQQPTPVPRLEFQRGASAWNSHKKMVDILERIPLFMEAFPHMQPILPLDCAPCRTHWEVIAKGNATGIWSCFIPVKMTSTLQPLNVCCCGGYKAQLRWVFQAVEKSAELARAAWAHALGKVKSSGGQMHGVLPSNVSAPTI